MADSARTTLCGSLSLHAVSLGQSLHMAGYRALGLDYFYMPFQLGPGQLEGALAGMRALGIRGFGVSMPFKLAIMELVDALDPVAERIGAVNTVVNDAGRLTGYNTDAWGARAALEEALPLAGSKILMVGAGGAARAVGFGLIEGGAQVDIANRRPERGEQLAERLRNAGGAARYVGTSEQVTECAPYAALVNASSVGMADVAAGSPLPNAPLRPGLVVMDIVYKPVQTEWLEAARAAGATTLHGGRMLLHQAARQFQLYTGSVAPLQAMDSALRAQLGF